MDGSDFDFYLCSCCPSGKGDMDVTQGHKNLVS